MAAMEVDQAAERVNPNSCDGIKLTEKSSKNGKASEKIEICSDSRDRKKSKYLSYPYTGMALKRGGLPEADNLKTTPRPTRKAKTKNIATKLAKGSSSYAKLDCKRFRKIWYRKFVGPSSILSSSEFINVSSKELLSGLYSKAVDCMFPMKKKRFDLFESFFYRYRISEFHDDAEIAASLVNLNGGNTEETVDCDVKDIKNGKRKRKYDQSENKLRPKKMKSLSGLSDVNISCSAVDTKRPARKRKQKNVEEVSVNQLQNLEKTSNDSIGRNISVSEAPQNETCLASENAAEMRNNEEAAHGHQSAQVASVNVQSNKCSSLIIDLQLASPSMSGGVCQNTGENKEALVLTLLNPDLHVAREGIDGNNTYNGMSKSPAKLVVGNVMVSETGSKSKMDKVSEGNATNELVTPEVGSVMVNETRIKDGTEKAAEGSPSSKLAAEIPDLNGTVSESNSLVTEFDNGSMLSFELKSDQSSILSACTGTTKTSSCRLEHNGEASGNCLLLQYASGANLPSKEDLMAAFFRFGPLKASDTKLFKDTASAQIVFVRNADAGEAFRSLQQNNPFGAALVDYKLHHLAAACTPPTQLTTPAWSTGSAVQLMASPPPTISKAQKMAPTQPNACTGQLMTGAQLMTSTQPIGSTVQLMNSARPNGCIAPLVTSTRPTGSTMQVMTPTLPNGSTMQMRIPTSPIGSMPTPGEAHPPLNIIKQNLQMMTSMLENSGNNLPPQMRAKLESELKNLLKKVNSKDGSSLKSEH
ncbi:hypothetical protein PIB30_060145 [Stylosanthes scabra]|uniref:Serine/threonine-protein kinase ATM n=1 Tax=Stylosanthes scabra TaxID=79078 RepID=A0ABU6RLC4_9FABA|nr:hypothetical protein [Stylosanthes scabra]